MTYDGLFYEQLVDPNGEAHQIGDIHCSGCAFKAPQPLCQCGGLNHYWVEDEDDHESFVAYECERCGQNENLNPLMSGEWA
jgi:hypothetical protein